MRPKARLLPGLDGLGGIFFPFVEVLESHDWDTYIQSFSPDQTAYVDLLQTLPAPSGEVVVAESFAGPLAIQYATKYPNDIAGLVLVATFPRFASKGIAFATATLAKFTKPPRFALQEMLLNGTHNERLLDALSESVHAIPQRTMSERLSALSQVDVREELRQLKVPTLALHATRDRVVRSDKIQSSEHITAVDIEGPHLLLQTKPHECFAAMDSWLKKNSLLR